VQDNAKKNGEQADDKAKKDNITSYSSVASNVIIAYNPTYHFTNICLLNRRNCGEIQRRQTFINFRLYTSVIILLGLGPCV